MALRFSVLGAAATVLLVAGCSSDGGTTRSNVGLMGNGGLGVAGNSVLPTGQGGATVLPQGTGGAVPQGQGGSALLGKGGTPVGPLGNGGAVVGSGGNTPTGGAAGADPGGAAGSGGGAAGAGGGVAGAAGGPPLGDAPTAMTASNKGPYTVKTYTSGYKDGAQFADATVHYPDGAPPPYPIVTVVPGFVSPQSSIQTWGPFLASHGIVTMTIGTNSTADPPATRELALMDSLDSLAGENTRTGSPLVGKLDLTRKAVMGWSMGGGGTLLAANDHPELKAVVSMCAWNPGFQYTKDTVPTLMFAGTADTLAGGQSQGFYTSIPAMTPKLLYEVNGGSHFVSNDPAGENKQIGLFGLSWLKVYLVGDDRYKQFLLVKPMNAATYTTNLM
jgi:dienelactone hydrolase